VLWFEEKLSFCVVWLELITLKDWRIEKFFLILKIHFAKYFLGE